MPSYFVYILECIDQKNKKSYYTGYTQDLNKRFQLHCEGKGAKYTKGKDLQLKYTEVFSNRSEAIQRELEIKKLTKQQKNNLIQFGEQSHLEES